MERPWVKGVVSFRRPPFGVAACFLVWIEAAENVGRFDDESR